MENDTKGTAPNWKPNELLASVRSFPKRLVFFPLTGVVGALKMAGFGILAEQWHAGLMTVCAFTGPYLIWHVYRPRAVSDEAVKWQRREAARVGVQEHLRLAERIECVSASPYSLCDKLEAAANLGLVADRPATWRSQAESWLLGIHRVIDWYAVTPGITLGVPTVQDMRKAVPESRDRYPSAQAAALLRFIYHAEQCARNATVDLDCLHREPLTQP